MAVFTIEFDDWGQDFLEWDVEESTGEIIGCRPFQGSIWCGKYVQDVELLRPSHLVHITDVPASEVTDETEILSVIHRVLKITIQ